MIQLTILTNEKDILGFLRKSSLLNVTRELELSKHYMTPKRYHVIEAEIKGEDISIFQNDLGEEIADDINLLLIVKFNDNEYSIFLFDEADCGEFHMAESIEEVSTKLSAFSSTLKSKQFMQAIDEYAGV